MISRGVPDPDRSVLSVRDTLHKLEVASSRPHSAHHPDSRARSRHPAAAGIALLGSLDCSDLHYIQWTIAAVCALVE